MSVAENASPRWKKAAGLIALGLLGAAVGAGLVTFTEGRFSSWEDELNFFLGAVLVLMALVTGVLMAARPASTPKGFGALQIAVLCLAGAMLMLPILAPAEWQSPWVFGAVIGLLIVQSVLNLILWNRSDELIRRVTGETSALSFWVLQGALLVYASAERLGLVETISGWGLLAILMSVYLLASMVAAWRRGLT
ncbi:hypothetical protein [Brevundimonas sp.]|uniref:hypothetical protein n=1 Tax=Brevundimonas sp. TaxID=1871086 RepID=UPI0025FC2A1C|nr:hypothetical protein [Brevundimonas sp.]